jgi:L(+)-tartrate dehydratase beta subunit
MKKILNLPLCNDSLSGLKTGDIVYLSGTVVTGRDVVYQRIAQEEMIPPVDLSGGAIFHAGPIVREISVPHLPKEYEPVSIGPTSSIRMEKWAARFLEKTGVKIMIGKGGMGKETSDGCRKYGAIHCVYPGGCAVLGAEQIEKIEGVFWPELGMAECLWVMKACELGPLIVSIDTQGNNLFAENSAFYASRREFPQGVPQGVPAWLR